MKRTDVVNMEPSQQMHVTGLRAVALFFQSRSVEVGQFRACVDCGTVEGWLDPEQLHQKIGVFGSEALKKRVGTSSPIPATPALDSGSLPRPGEESPDRDD